MAEALMVTLGAVGRGATWILIVALLLGSLLLVAGERGVKRVRRRRLEREKREKERARAKRKKKGPAKKRVKKKEQKVGLGLIRCRHCQTRYTNPRGHVCRLSWSKVQKMRK